VTASELTGRVALITGAGRGIGRATALALAQAGADVAVAGRSSAELEQTAALVGAQHRRSATAICDVGSDQAVRDAIAHVHRLLGAIDILVNNAAVLEPLGRSATIDPQAWAWGLNINLTGAFRCIQAVLAGMLERGWGRIVNVTAGMPHTGLPQASAYSVSKAGLDMLTRHLGAELAGTGVTVNSVWPGAVKTRMLAAFRASRGAAWRPGDLDPAQPARLIARLVASDHNGEIVDLHGPEGRQLLRS
jgi:NAD(P)-dependent dehydrogenase (short-subunit alcohol dehydrogenase family)